MIVFEIPDCELTERMRQLTPIIYKPSEVVFCSPPPGYEKYINYLVGMVIDVLWQNQFLYVLKLDEKSSELTGFGCITVTFEHIIGKCESKLN